MTRKQLTKDGKYVVCGGGGWLFALGEIVTLSNDDNTTCPGFTNGKSKFFFYLKHLEPLTPELAENYSIFN